MPTAEILRLQQEDKEIREIAEEAKNSISTHEQLCALRYDAINKTLEQIKRVGVVGLLLIASLVKSDKLAEVLKALQAII